MQNILQKLVLALKELLGLVPKLQEMEYLPLTKENIDILKEQIKPTMQDKFLQICKDALDSKISPNNPVPDEVSCAYDISLLIRQLPEFQDFKIQASTKMLDGQLFLDKKRFKNTNTPELGSIWIYPSITDSKGNILVHGHALVQIMSDRLASNNSLGKDKGKFTGNYTIEQARKEFIEKRGLKEYIYGFRD